MHTNKPLNPPEPWPRTRTSSNQKECFWCDEAALWASDYALHFSTNPLSIKTSKILLLGHTMKTGSLQIYAIATEMVVLIWIKEAQCLSHWKKKYRPDKAHFFLLHLLIFYLDKHNPDIWSLYCKNFQSSTWSSSKICYWLWTLYPKD